MSMTVQSLARVSGPERSHQKCEVATWAGRTVGRERRASGKPWRVPMVMGRRLCYEGAHEKPDRGDAGRGDAGLRAARGRWRPEDRRREDALRARHDHREEPRRLQ